MFPVIQIGFVRLNSFNLLVGAGLLFWVCAAIWQLKRLRLTYDLECKVLQSIPYSFIVTFIVAGLSDILLRWRHFLLHPYRFGITFYGGLVGFILFWWVFSKINRVDIKSLLNAFLPPVAIGQAFGRIGCFLGGCCHGKEFIWCGIVPHPDSPAFAIYGNNPVFPVQLAESAWLFMVGILLLLNVKFEMRAAWYLILVGAGRFMCEFMRGDVRNEISPDFPLSPAQCLSILLVICGFLVKLSARRCIPS